MKDFIKPVFSALLLTCVLATHSSWAAKKLQVCAKYSNTGRAYQVQATEITGTELNQATNSFSYNSFSTYAVIFWGEGQASVIELSGIGGISPFDMPGVDQNGREWTISTSTFCY